jgi:hypothetical protein
VTAAVAVVVSVLAFGAGPGRAAAAGARPSGGGVSSISCASAGECTAVGVLDFRDQARPLVVGEKNGRWGSAGTVPGLSASPLDDHGAWLEVVSCLSAGNCAAGGSYSTDAGGNFQPLVVSERNGVWGNAVAIAGLASLNTGKSAEVQFMSCRSAWNCTAAGTYETADVADHVFVVSETNGAWGKAQPIRGLTGPGAVDSFVDGLSCGSPGNCTLAGFWAKGGAFSATQKNGAWSAVQPFTGLTDGTEIDTLTCWPDGTCTAIGGYRGVRIFSITRTRGTWGKPRLIPGLAALPGAAPGNAFPGASSCPSPGNCTLGGEYRRKHDRYQAFVASQKHGTWSRARALPGLAELNTGKEASFVGLVCFSAGTCTAAGDYAIQHKKYVAYTIFVAAEKNGTWRPAERVPGARVNLGTNADLLALSCGAPGNCSIGGIYQVKTDEEPFIDTQENGTWATAQPIRGVGGKP